MFNIKKLKSAFSSAPKNTVSGVPKDSVTVVIPSKDRAHDLSALLGYFNAARIPYKILVLLSGTRGRPTGVYKHLDLEIAEFDEQTTLFAKLKEGLTKVQTPLTAMCTDDDVVLPEALAQCCSFLLENPHYSAAQGYHALFSEDKDIVNLHSITYFTPSLDSPEPLLRLDRLIRRYQQISWAVFQSGVVKEAISRFSGYSNIAFNELLWSGITALKGPVKRLPVIYCLRRIDKLHFMGHPLYGMMQHPRQFFREYENYRNILMEYMPDSLLGADDLQRAVDLLHCCFFGSAVELWPLNYFTDKVLLNPKTSVHDADIDKALRPAPLNLLTGWQKEVCRGNRRYRFFPELLKPEPKEEILLPLHFEQKLIDDVHGYFEK